MLAFCGQDEVVSEKAEAEIYHDLRDDFTLTLRVPQKEPVMLKVPERAWH